MRNQSTSRVRLCTYKVEGKPKPNNRGESEREREDRADAERRCELDGDLLGRPSVGLPGDGQVADFPHEPVGVSTDARRHLSLDRSGCVLLLGHGEAGSLTKASKKERSGVRFVKQGDER